MTLDALLNALARNGTRVKLSPSGTLKVTGTPLSPALLAEVKVHKAEVVAALDGARSTAAQLYRAGGIDTFAAELDAARERGSLSVTDWCAGLLALKLARRWQGTIERIAA